MTRTEIIKTILEQEGCGLPEAIRYYTEIMRRYQDGLDAEMVNVLLDEIIAEENAE